MQLTTTHRVPAATIGGQDITITLSFAGFLSDGNALAHRDTVVTYTVTDGTNTISGDDMRTAPGWTDIAESLCRSLCSFLCADVEHAEWHDRMPQYMSGAEGCHEHGDKCPALDAERIAALSSMYEALSLASGCADYPSEGAELVSVVESSDESDSACDCLHSLSELVPHARCCPAYVPVAA